MKAKNAVDFINGLRRMETKDLNELIAREVGVELASFFQKYSKLVMEKDAEAGTLSLMLMGYLIRAEEERTRPLPVPFQQPVGLA